MGVINVADEKCSCCAKKQQKLKKKSQIPLSLNKNQQIATDLSFLEIIQPNKNNKFNEKTTLLPAAQICFKHRT